MEEAEEANELITALNEEVDQWKAKYKKLELKKRESDLALNKIKTEINSLRSVDKQWKDSAKSVYLNLNDMKFQFDAQIDQIMDGLDGVTKSGERVTSKIPYNRKLKSTIAALQKRIAQQEETIMNLNAKIRVLTAELADKTAKVERLSAGIEEEVDRLMKPMRDRLSDSMILIMKEKAARAQERRELADLWPQDHLMPSLLMKHRALTDEERERRVKLTTEQNASYALSQEIRANVSESKLWEMKYDDYGRPFYEHMKTGETNWEQPEIMHYKPPPGRDEMGNLIVSEESMMSNWRLMTDSKGEVYYQHRTTGGVTYVPPNAYREVPRGKSRELLVGEGAQLILNFIKEKISKHIERTKELKEKLENPLTPEDKKRIEKEQKQKTVEEKDEEAKLKAARDAEDAAEPIDLSQYQYDIETVEMLADKLLGGMASSTDSKKADKEADILREERRAFLEESDVRSFDKDLFIAPTIAEIDLEAVTVVQLRGVVEDLALREEKLEKQIYRVRDNMKDFSFVLMERMVQEERERAEQLKREQEEREKERRAQQKEFMIQKQQEAKRLAEEQQKERNEEDVQNREQQEAFEKQREDLLNAGENDATAEATSSSEAKDSADAAAEGDVTDEQKGAADASSGEPVVAGENAEAAGVSAGAAAESKGPDDDTTFNPDASLDTGSFNLGNDATEKARRKKKTRKKEKRALIDNKDAGDGSVVGDDDTVTDDDDEDDSDDDNDETSSAGDDDEDDDAHHGPKMSPDDPNYFQTGFNAQLTNYGAMLFGDPSFNPSEPDCSEEVMKVSTDLCNFALFCGFTALRMSEYPNDYTVEYSLKLDDCRAAQHVSKDDDWLSASFFMSCTAESMDALRAATRTGYTASAGLLPIGPLDPEVLVLETPQQEKFQRSKDKSYTYGTSEVEEVSKNAYQAWRSRQLMTEILRQQIQRDAVQEAFQHRMDAFKSYSVFNDPSRQQQQSIHSLDLAPHSNDKIIPFVRLNVRKIYFDMKFTGLSANEYYVYLKIGNWVARTHPQVPSPQGFLWEMLEISGSLPVNDMQLEYLVVEIIDQNPSDPSKAFIGKGRATVDHSLGANMGRNTEVEMEIIDLEKAILGKAFVTLNADVNAFVPYKDVDPRHLQNLEINTQEANEIPLRSNLDKEAPSVVQSVAVSAPSTAFSERISSLHNLVAELRGDGVEFIRLLTGDFSVRDIEKTGVKINGSVTKNMPDFNKAALFLEKKTNRHRWELESLLEQIEAEQVAMVQFLDEKFETTSKVSTDMKNKVQRMNSQSEDLKREVLRVQKTVADLRKEHPEPKQPEFEEFQPVPYVPKLPVSGGLDARGKKKKPLKNDELKKLVDMVVGGELDGKETWPMPEGKFPSQAQLVKLGKAMSTRNGVLDAKRNQEKEYRAKMEEMYETDFINWKAHEKKRKIDLEVAKKECRKVNMKFDSFMELMTRQRSDYDALEFDLNTIADLKNLNDKSLERFKIMRFKQEMEYRRLKEYLQSLKLRLLRAIKARRFALDLPSTAANDFEYAKFVKQAEAALPTLRMEIFECKHLLQSEGWRLRTLFEEEYKLANNELSRVRMSKEVAVQRDCFDQILVRYRFEVLNLLKDMEKLKAAETDKDETGQETVEDLGERYIPEKKWQSPDIQRLQRLIDIMMAKINLTDGLGRSTGQSQKLLMDVMVAKFGNDILPMRDSWTENADFVRSQRLLEDTLQWAQLERTKISSLRKQTVQDRVDLGLQLDAAQQQQQVAVVTHETETVKISHHSSEVIDVMRTHLKDFREETSLKVQELENSIVELSRECQGVREQLLAQQLQFDDKIKVLWAFIHTLQTAVQQLSARMEMVLEERERIVIESKLVADRMRHHLRLERKHCSNLLFLIQSQRGTVKFLTDVIAKLNAESKAYRSQQTIVKGTLRREIWEQIFAFTRLGTDVDALFEFFAARLANLAGARSTLNNALARNGAAQVLGALCKSPRPLIRKFAARAMGGMGWDGFVETRILLWDCVMYWKMYKASVIAKETKAFQSGLETFNETGQFEAILNIKGEVEEFVPSGNMSLRTIIKQRRQWALRAARRREGPNFDNQKQINVRDGVIPSLMEMCIRDGTVDWEISRNAALAVSIASYEPSNHHDMAHSQICREMVIKMCSGIDPEVQTHAAVTIANLCHKDEEAQLLFGEAGAIEVLIDLSICSVVDVLEASTGALANLTCYCDANCKRALEHGGVEAMVRVTTHAYSQNLLDLDQNDEVQANAAEVLANISRFCTEDTLPYFDAAVVDALVLMCASPNKQLRRHVPLVLGNIAQSENCRYEIGVKGGVEALFLVIEDMDNAIQANTLWALCNLMWHPPNQERAGRFMTEVIDFLRSPWVPTRSQAVTLLANMLYYNNPNRIRMLECEGAMELVLGFIKERNDVTMVEGSLRAVLSISYIDGIAMWLGTEGDCIPLFISYLLQPFFSRDSMRYSLEIICNLCLHHDNRRIIYENDGIDAVVSLHIDSDVHIQELSKQIIGHLEDITPPDVLARAKVEIGLDRMLTLASSSDPLVRAVAAESIGEELWQDPKKQHRAQKLGGVDALLAICANPSEEVESVLPALWSLRNLLYDHSDAKAQFGYRDGISVVNSVFRNAFSGRYIEQTEKVLEAGVACLTTAAYENEKNARKVLMIALPALLDMADGKLRQMASLADALRPPKRQKKSYRNRSGSYGDDDGDAAEDDVMTVGADDATAATASTFGGGVAVDPRQLQENEKALTCIYQALESEGIQSIARALLLALAPFNYVVCRNCHRKQDLSGTSCYNCGYRLLPEIDTAEVEMRRMLNRPPFTDKNGNPKAMNFSSSGRLNTLQQRQQRDTAEALTQSNRISSTSTRVGVHGLKQLSQERGASAAAGMIRSSNSAPAIHHANRGILDRAKSGDVAADNSALPPRSLLQPTAGSRPPLKTATGIIIDDSISLASNTSSFIIHQQKREQPQQLSSKTLPEPIRPRSSNKNLNTATQKIGGGSSSTDAGDDSLPLTTGFAGAEGESKGYPTGRNASPTAAAADTATMDATADYSGARHDGFVGGKGQQAPSLMQKGGTKGGKYV